MQFGRIIARWPEFKKWLRLFADQHASNPCNGSFSGSVSSSLFKCNQISYPAVLCVYTGLGMSELTVVTSIYRSEGGRILRVLCSNDLAAIRAKQNGRYIEETVVSSESRISKSLYCSIVYFSPSLAGSVCVCGCSPSLPVHYCVLLDAVWGNHALSDVGACLQWNIQEMVDILYYWMG